MQIPTNIFIHFIFTVILSTNFCSSINILFITMTYSYICRSGFYLISKGSLLIVSSAFSLVNFTEYPKLLDFRQRIGAETPYNSIYTHSLTLTLTKNNTNVLIKIDSCYFDKYLYTR